MLVYNYPADACDPEPPQLVRVDEFGDVITNFHAAKITNQSMLDDITQLYTDSGFLAPDQSIVAWAIGSPSKEGSYPDPFCFSPDEIYALASMGNGFVIKDGIVTLGTWYSDDTTGIPSTLDLITNISFMPPNYLR